jgi:hypothetical protein
MRGGLLALLAIGATGGAKALVWPSGGTTVAPTNAGGGGDGPAAQHIGVGGFGELYVSAWLSAGRDSEDVLAPYYPEPVNLAQIESGVFWASRTATVEVSVEGEDYWSVVVAADVLRAGDGGAFEPAGIRFFGFGVVRDVDGFVATSLPAQVPPPPTIEVPERVIDGLERPGGELEAVAQALDHFFAALLAGSGDLERYLSPDAQLAAIAPAPFAETEVRSLGARPEAADPSRLLVRAEVVGRDGGGAGQVLSYTVTVRQRAGRWEVVELVPATPLVGVEAPAGAGDGRPETGSTSTSIEKED